MQRSKQPAAYTECGREECQQWTNTSCKILRFGSFSELPWHGSCHNDINAKRSNKKIYEPVMNNVYVRIIVNWLQMEWYHSSRESGPAPCPCCFVWLRLKGFDLKMFSCVKPASEKTGGLIRWTQEKLATNHVNKSLIGYRFKDFTGKIGI